VQNGKNFFKPPAISFDPISNKVGFAYSLFQSIYLARSREYDLNRGFLQNAQTIAQPPIDALTAGSLLRNIQGEFAIFNGGIGFLSSEFIGVRKPFDISGYLNDNMLLTGNEYFNAPIPPYCRTNGANVEALANSNTRLKQKYKNLRRYE
jgi:hypothetical protein